jgi:hypothetical protein
MGFAVYHLEKGQTSSGGIGNHIDRKEGAEHTYPHADPERKHLNKNFEVFQGREKLPLSKAIQDRVKEGYTSSRKIRANTVMYKTHILTGTHEDMKRIFSNEKTANAWIEKNKEFINKEFGEKNVVRFSLHLDEKTPHIHAVTIPLTNDGRLSAKEIVGNKAIMQQRQDRYAESMKDFGLERGIRNTGISHENATAYYSRISEAEKNVSALEIKAEKNSFGVYKSESVEHLEKAFNSANLALNDKNIKAEKVNLKMKFLENENLAMKKFSKEQTAQYEELRKGLNDFLKNPEALEEAKQKALAEKEQNRGFDELKAKREEKGQEQKNSRKLGR